MKKTGVSFGLAALLTLSCLVSCITKDNTLGSALVPANQDISIRTATFSLPVGLKMADSLQTSVSQSATVGTIRTDRYGLYRSDAAVAVTASYDSISWGKNPSVISIKMTLVCDSAMVVKASERYIPQNLYVHRLKVTLDSTRIYNNSLTDADYDPEVLSLGGVVYDGGSSYTVELDPKLGEELLKFPMDTLDDDEKFMKLFKGLYLRCDDPVEGLEGGRLNNFNLSSSYIAINYAYDDEDGNRRTRSDNFIMGEYYSVNVCSSGARPLEEPLAFDALYMEGTCGIKPHIAAADLRAMMEEFAAAQGFELNRMLIAKAVLCFPFEYNGDYKQFDYYATTLFPCKRTKSKSSTLTRYTPLDEIEDDTLESGGIDRADLSYSANISRYLQKLISRSASSITADDDLWIMPTLAMFNSYTSTTNYYADYLNYTQSQLNGMGDDRHPVLELTYAVLK